MGQVDCCCGLALCGPVRYAAGTSPVGYVVRTRACAVVVCKAVGVVFVASVKYVDRLPKPSGCETLSLWWSAQYHMRSDPAPASMNLTANNLQPSTKHRILRFLIRVLGLDLNFPICVLLDDHHICCAWFLVDRVSRIAVRDCRIISVLSSVQLVHEVLVCAIY